MHGRLVILRNGRYDNAPIEIVTSTKKLVDVDKFYGADCIINKKGRNENKRKTRIALYACRMLYPGIGLCTRPTKC